MIKEFGFLALLLIIIYISYIAIKGLPPKNQFGGNDIVFQNTIVEPLLDKQVVYEEVFYTNNKNNINDNADVIATNLLLGDFRNADFTDNNLTRSDVNTIVNGPSYMKSQLNNMYFTGDVVDGIGNYTVDGNYRIQNPAYNKDESRLTAIPVRNLIGIEADPLSMIDYRPRRNDTAFEISKSGINSLEVRQVYDFMDRKSYTIRIKGILPTPCNQLRILPLRLSGNNIILNVYSIVDPILQCPNNFDSEWQVTIPLVILPPNKNYNIVLNKELVLPLLA